MTFLSPYLLLFLLLLPALWWLVRAIPPQPRKQRFPSLVLLRSLSPVRQDAARTPLWLLLLRLTALTLLILAFSRPLLIPRQDRQPPQKLVLILDDGWAAIPHWEERRQTALALGEATLRSGGQVTLLLSTPDADGHMPRPFQPADRAALQQFLSGLSPHTWPGDRQALARQMQGLAQDLHEATVISLSDGLAQPGDDALRAALHPAHHTDDIRWPRCDLIRLSVQQNRQLTALAETLPDCPKRTLRLLGMTLEKDGHLAGRSAASLSTGTRHTLPDPDQADAFSLPSVPGPAGMVLLPGRAEQHRVGLLRTSGDDTPLTGSSFYLARAMQAITPYQEGSLDSLLPRHPDIIIATDGSLSGTALKDMLGWVRKGGILIRFAGPELARQSQQDMQGDEAALLPVPLLSGMRQLGGPMSWGSPQKLAPFPADTPFAGLTVPDDATISRQLLAQPTDDLSRHVWATLTDGTPLVTARQEGQGLIILFHVTPTADWSSLPLSGLFPQMMERLVTRTPVMQKRDISDHAPSDSLAPWRILNSDKTLVPPPPTVRPVLRMDGQSVEALHPVGFYGGAAQHHPLNLADHQPPLADEPALGQIRPAGQAVPERPLWPILMLPALGLLLLDLLLSLARSGLFRFSRSAALCLGIGLLGIQPLQAATTDQTAPASQSVPPAALAIRLAHVQTGDSATDDAVQQGLEGLTRFLNQRSTTHLDSPVGVVPGQDDLAFYPLLYWPITPGTRLDAAGRAALKNYIQHNGMILIDEMGAGSDMDGTDGHATRTALRAATEGLPIPPLTTLNDQHTLSHTFYLLHDFPGRIAGQPVYVARQGNEDSEDVSPVIIGNADWAHAWAVDQNGEHPFAVIPDGESQRTLAYRFGFNTIIYALTGNYKNDQRHYPEMLKRLRNGDDDSPDGTDESEAP
ncbi:DUF4159 domain-containing protein [Bombella mellum]|uniref:DUF4159 domain-containing protein n=1 Tax=Bombella mellum TaxID=2039288 RepID=A0ABR5ZTD9_9PROT|nr:DUF4159 domain-containing protein [Bombella mellum]MBA5727589.1 hypothetical protein [Bombella mellum]